MTKPSVMRTTDGVFSGQTLGARERQEDAVAHRLFDGNQSILVVLADGMGGHQGGEVASRTSVDAFTSAFFSDFAPLKIPYRLFGSLERANKELEALGKKNTELEGMGTTLIAAVLSSAGMSWISVGDSLLLRVRGSKIQRLNEDHSMAPVLDEAAKKGTLTPQEARSHKDRNALRSALSGAAIDLVDVTDQPEPLREGDVILLASDGLLTLNQDEIVSCVHSQKTAGASAIVSRLLEAVSAKNMRRQDNTTIAAIVIERSSIKNSLFRWGSLRSWVIGTALAAVFILLGFGAGKGFPPITSMTKLFSTVVGEVKALVLPSHEVTREGANEIQPIDISDAPISEDESSTDTPPVNVSLPKSSEQLPQAVDNEDFIEPTSNEAKKDKSRGSSGVGVELRPAPSPEKNPQAQADGQSDLATESTVLEITDSNDTARQSEESFSNEKIKQNSKRGIEDVNAGHVPVDSEYASHAEYPSAPQAGSKKPTEQQGDE